MQRIEVTASRRYHILIQEGLLSRVGEECTGVLRGEQVLLLTDETVAALYEDTVRTSLEKAGFRVWVYRVPAGETSKSVEWYLKIIAFLAEHRFTRSDAVVALGGGVVGDLGGFCAASYLRGIGLVQVPTTLLACVDSSVGGKTAVNLPQGKNLLGSFYQPWLVLCDPHTLRTLSPAVYADGMAEVIKYGMIRDAALFEALEQNTLSDGKIICRCVAIKRDIVEADEHDRGCRQLLNFGHTAGHAVEQCSHFSVSHGSAVAIGMAIVTRAMAAQGKASPELCRRLETLLAAKGLPVHSPYTCEALYEASLADKKRGNRTLQAVVVPALGCGELAELSLEEWKAYLERGCEK